MTELLPHDIDAEEATLGSLLIGADINLTQIETADFYSERNQFIFASCRELRERNVSINQITVAQELASHDKLANCGGAAYLSHLIANCPTSLDYQYYAEIVHRLAWYRKLIKASESISKIGYQAQADVSDSMNKADDILLELRKCFNSTEIIDPEKRIELMNDRYAKLYEMEGVMAVSTGLKDLDRMLGGGFFQDDLILVGARTSMGKTTLLQNLANYIAQKGNVMVFSCEMGWEALGDRDVAGLAGIPINTVRLGGYSPELYTSITATLETIRNYKIYTYDKTPITTAIIHQTATAMKLRKGLAAIVVDYLGLLDDDIGENRNITLGYMTKKLKQIARELGVPVIVAHQLSRELEKREDKRPILPDLRESGHVEEDADAVLFVYRDDYYYDEAKWERLFRGSPYPKNITEIIIAKQRNGAANTTVRVYFDEVHQLFKDLAFFE